MFRCTCPTYPFPLPVRMGSESRGKVVLMPARKETRSLAKMIADVAYHKSRAARARFAGTRPGLESPREVYLASCASIAAHLVDSFGFKYAKSGPRVWRRSGDFTFEVNFQSSHHNVAGEHVVLWIHGIVSSPRILKWRETQTHLHPIDYVAGGQLGNLQADYSWMEWQLAKRRKRDETIRDAVKAIEELALPYFAKFENLPSLVKTLVKKEMPSMSIDRVIEFLMCFADQPTARLAAANFLRTRRELQGEYRDSYQKYGKNGIEDELAPGYPGDLALASHAYKFGDLTAKGA